jgi:hypothetical protein
VIGSPKTSENSPIWLFPQVFGAPEPAEPESAVKPQKKHLLELAERQLEHSASPSHAHRLSSFRATPSQAFSDKTFPGLKKFIAFNTVPLKPPKVMILG